MLFPLMLIMSVAAVEPPEPFQPKVDDPLLNPAARPKTQVASWEEARTILATNSPDLKTAEAAVDRAEGRWRQSLGFLLPNARFGAGLEYDILNPDRSPIDGGEEIGATIPSATANISMTQTVLDLSALHGLHSASSAEDSARASFQDVQRRLTQGLARVLVAVVAAERIAELNRLGLRQALERAALTKRTQELGAATHVDVVRVEQDVEVARGALIAGDEQLQRTREALGQTLGLGVEVGVQPGFALQGLVAETAVDCTKVQWTERPDLVAAKKNVEVANESKKQASAGYLPTIGVNSTLFAVTTEEDFGKFARWSIGAVLSLPIWEGGARAGLVAERRAAERQAEEALKSAQNNVEIEVARARRGVEVATALVETASTARARAAELDNLTRRSFEVGRGSSLELVQSAATLRQADVTLATREFELVQSRIDALLTEATCDF